MRLRTLLLCGLLLLTAPAAAAQENAGTPRFEPGACLFPPPESYTVECGFLVVRENRADPASAEIRLAVALFRSNNPEKAPDPLIYLEGGPGGSAFKATAPVFEQVLAPYARYRDVIVLDQRGVGFSQPALDCPEFYDYTLASLAGSLSVDEDAAQVAAAVAACYGRLTASGADLSAYSSAASAADLRDLAAVFEFDQVNLLGTSYGARLALTAMRDDPQLVRSAVLAGVFPPQVSLSADTPANLSRALAALFAACAADQACSAAYPGLEARFYELGARLNAEPAALTVLNPATQAPLEVLVSGDELYGAVFRMLYSSDLLPLLPQGIAAAADGDYSALTKYLLLNLVTETLISRGVYFSVQCNEDAIFDAPDALEASVAAFPQFEGFLRRSGDFGALCRSAWGVSDADPAENEPVSSDVPALLISGGFDPVTPPEWGALAAATLPNSTHVVIANASHDAFLTACATELALAFLNDPAAELDTACAQGQAGIVFALPSGAADLGEIALVPYSDPDGLFTALVPESWVEVQAGVYARGASPVDQMALILAPLPLPLADFLQAAAAQLGLDAPPTTTAQEANGLTWSLFEADFSGFPTVVAAVERDGMTYTVQLVANSAAERAALREAVLLPVLDAFALGE